MNPGVGDTPFCEAVPDAFHHGARAAGEEIEVIAREMLLEQERGDRDPADGGRLDRVLRVSL